jgi:Peptidase_C39 like family
MMIRTCPKRLLVLAVAVAVLGQNALAADKTLDIDPVYQETPEWCWLAVGQMIFQYYDEPIVNGFGDFQCGIIALYGGPQSSCWYNCRTCPVPGGSTQSVVQMLRGYPVAAAQLLGRPRRLPLHVQSKAGPLDFDELKDEIDKDRPVVAGINLSGGFAIPGQAQHVVLIIGYDDVGQTLTVNDPFPYEAFGVYPYQVLNAGQPQQGQYIIDYAAFKNRMRWTVSLLGITDPNN